MIGCLRTRVCKQPIIALYFEFETVLKFYNLEARSHSGKQSGQMLKIDFLNVLENHTRPQFLFDSIFYVPVNNFQLCPDETSWVEPVLSKG